MYAVISEQVRPVIGNSQRTKGKCEIAPLHSPSPSTRFRGDHFSETGPWGTIL